MAERVPELRPLDAKQDAALLRRIAAIRANLPAQFRKRNNFAWAVAKIDGLEKTEFFAHSAIQDLESLSSIEAGKIAGISLRRTHPEARFAVWCVNQRGVVAGPDCWERDVDTECKILEDLAARLADPGASGCVRLYTDLPPCPSCWNVMKQFLASYPQVRMQVLYRDH